MLSFNRDERRKSWRRFTWFHSLSAVLLFAFSAMAQERIGTTTQPRSREKGVEHWTTQNNTVPVCWETAGYDREKTITRAAVEGTWQFWANVDFTGWGMLPDVGGRAVRSGPHQPRKAAPMPAPVAPR